MKYYADTNFVLRLLLGDNVTQSNQAKKLLKQVALDGESVVILPNVVAECLYVLSGKTYQVPIKLASSQILNLFNNSVFQPSDSALANSLIYLKAHPGVEFVDCYLAQLAQLHKTKVVSFDKDINQIVPKIRVEI